MADKAVRVVQPVAVPPTTAAAAVENQNVAPPSGMCASPHQCRYFLCDQEGHFIASCPIWADMFWFKQQAGRSGAPLVRRNVPALPPVLFAEGVADGGKAVS